MYVGLNVSFAWRFQYNKPLIENFISQTSQNKCNQVYTVALLDGLVPNTPCTSLYPSSPFTLHTPPSPLPPPSPDSGKHTGRSWYRPEQTVPDRVGTNWSKGSELTQFIPRKVLLINGYTLTRTSGISSLSRLSDMTTCTTRPVEKQENERRVAHTRTQDRRGCLDDTRGLWFWSDLSRRIRLAR